MKTFSKILKPVIGLIMVAMLAGCSGVFSYLDPDYGPGRLFPTSVVAEKGDIKIYKPMADVQKTGFVYLKTRHYMDDEGFYALMKKDLQTIGFKKIYGTSELIQDAARQGLADRVKNLDDMASLKELAKTAGPFIVMEATVERGAFVSRRNLRYINSNRYKLDLKIIDPATGGTFLDISRDQFAVRFINRQILHPVLNVVNDWYRESAKLTAAKP